MLERVFITRLFLTTGGLLALVGLVLWFALPIPSVLPPYLFTALVALGYGAACQWGGMQMPPKDE